ncbi:MAG TPA: Lrp/AsnC family transcriptional regulator [Terracidiphilus sp.]|nr:Lrp/AsnC family transcriptional regulator [Terracidiphilus sp.]
MIGTKNTKIDKTDLRILAELQMNSGRPVYELAHRLGLSMASCARRIKRLETAGVIERYVALLNSEQLDVDLDIFVNIRLSRHIHKEKQEFRNFVSTIPEVLACYSLTGDSDFLLHIRIAGVKEFNVWIEKYLTGLPHLSTTHSSVCLERLKFTTAVPFKAENSGPLGKTPKSKSPQKKPGRKPAKA